MVGYYETSAADIRIRFAEEKDIPLILELIKGLAQYEKMEDKVAATEERLRTALFEKKQAEVILAEYKGTAIGYALFFHQLLNLSREGKYLSGGPVRKAGRKRMRRRKSASGLSG